MARLVIAVFVVAAFAAATWLVLAGVKGAVKAGDRKVREATMGSETLSRIAFALLMALILYVAITGGQV